MAEPANDRGGRADFDEDSTRARAAIETNRLEMQREERRGVRIFIALVAMLVVAIAILGWTQP